MPLAHSSQPHPLDANDAPSLSRCGATQDPSPGVILPEGDILSCVVYTKPGRGADVARSITRFQGVQVHCGSEIDKLVATIEDVAGQPAADVLGALNQVEGVINNILIYHFGGPALAQGSPDSSTNEAIAGATGKTRPDHRHSSPWRNLP